MLHDILLNNLKNAVLVIGVLLVITAVFAISSVGLQDALRTGGVGLLISGPVCIASAFKMDSMER